eukprot:GHVS01059841.1.p1 GENE.GHVS01059841.1~~GHVS01059841.1.p1  ORF type:complete len:369 (+),score=21.16 GHVS01059841.1:187-1293(+)
MESLPPLPVPFSSYPPLLAPDGFSADSSTGKQLEADICQSESMRDWTVNRFGSNSLPAMRTHSRFPLLGRGCRLLSVFLIFLVVLLRTASANGPRYGRLGVQKYCTNRFLQIWYETPKTKFVRSRKEKIGRWEPNSDEGKVYVDNPPNNYVCVGTVQKFIDSRGFAALKFMHEAEEYDFNMVGRALKAGRMLLERIEYAAEPFNDSDLPGQVLVQIYPFIDQYKRANDLFEGILLSNLLGPDQSFVILIGDRLDKFTVVKAEDQKFFRVEARKVRCTATDFTYVYTSPVGEAQVTADTRDMRCGSTFFLFDQRQCKEINSHPEGKFVITYDEVPQLEVPFIESSQGRKGTPYIGKGQVNIGQFSVLRF